MSSRIRLITRLSMEAAEAELAAAAAAEAELQETDVQADDVAELVEARQAAADATDYVAQAGDVHDELTDVRDVSEVVNSQGGVSAESYRFLNASLRSVTRRTGIERPAELRMATQLRDGKRAQISLEAIDNMLAQVDDGTRRLEANSVETVERLVAALTESLPNAHARVRHVLELVKACEGKDRADCEGKQVVFGDGLNIALSVNGEVPSDLPAYLQRYIQLGCSLMEDYQQTAFSGAMKAVGIPDLLTYNSADDFWVNMDKAASDIKDARRCLTDEQRALVLPNTNSLFTNDDCEAKEGEHPTVTKLRKMVECCKINEQINNPAGVKPIAEGTAGYGRLCLSLTEITEVAEGFDRLIGKLDINAFAERSNGIRQDKFGVINRVREGFANAPADTKAQLTEDFSLVLNYLDTIYRLADWPVLNYLCNLVFTVNAFVLYAERCLALPEGAVEPVVEADSGAEDAVAAAVADEAPAEGAEAEVAAEPAEDAAASEVLEADRAAEDAENPIPADEEDEDTDAEGEADAEGAEDTEGEGEGEAEGEEGADDEQPVGEPVAEIGEEEPDDEESDEDDLADIDED